MSFPKFFPATVFVCMVVLAAFFFSRHISNLPSPQQLTLEQILSIKELHLVKHVYQDLFFIHKKNNHNKPIRAIVQVPVTVTAYINLKEIKILYKNDSVKQVILPHALLTNPNFHIDQMIIVRETRALQIHVGHDLYPMVAQYLSASMAERMEAMRKVAEDNHILAQAETEVREYVEMLLKAVGRNDVLVSFAQEGAKTSVK